MENCNQTTKKTCTNKQQHVRFCCCFWSCELLFLLSSTKFNEILQSVCGWISTEMVAIVVVVGTEAIY